ncbi:MAG: hypothetical protein IT225_09445 [Flavobacteriales bacterium]|jgi:hypothetical protein|nr:hypothetical protein [Flavobacteriales bacterium]
MLDQILDSLKQQAMPQLMNQFGLNEKQAGGSVKAAADSVMEAVSGGDGFGLDDALSLFSDSANSKGADGLLGNIGSLLQNKLTGQVGLDGGKASGVAGMLLPLITDLVTKQVGGNADNLKSLLGGGGIADLAKGFLGNLFKR